MRYAFTNQFLEKKARREKIMNPKCMVLEGLLPFSCPFLLVSTASAVSLTKPLLVKYSWYEWFSDDGRNYFRWLKKGSSDLLKLIFCELLIGRVLGNKLQLFSHSVFG